ncbi:putative spermidine/putrescine transport system permease protein [Formivibrio citricus]|uniref:Putative spermidine/putrescine transport system permease protein n=1 Tax=Formivibrio citricus TaxID=83765 RepID=A0A1I5A587_9NEIS|nr:ABC transporter permease [Formivibrio citricus]SFN57490.1 putative spermidine/putrescine transport system permease protein [Formivibrio citricus]
MTDTTLSAPPLLTVDGTPLKTRLRHIERLNQFKSLLLILPLIAFLVLTFLAPIAAMLVRSVDNPEVAPVLPKTVAAIQQWNKKSLPGEEAYAALASDLTAAKEDPSQLAEAAKRLNMEIPGFRSLVQKTARNLPMETEPESYKTALVELDERWGDPAYWHAIERNASTSTPFYLLSSLDMSVNDEGEIAKAEPDKAIYLEVFARTFWISAVVTVVCLFLGFPLAYLLATLPTRQSNLLMILVLLPFWTSVLVRVAAWIVLLQSGGLINGALETVGLIDEPLELVFNRTGVYISMVHILLPYMILPIYSVMKGISPSYMRAAISLGCHPIRSFWKVYFPQCIAGVAAGALLVFILCIGYYITPALLGGPKDQMVSYFVAFYTNTTINWGMATALGALLLLATVVLYAIYNRLVGANNLKLG